MEAENQREFPLRLAFRRQGDIAGPFLPARSIDRFAQSLFIPSPIRQVLWRALRQCHQFHPLGNQLAILAGRQGRRVRLAVAHGGKQLFDPRPFVFMENVFPAKTQLSFLAFLMWHTLLLFSRLRLLGNAALSVCLFLSYHSYKNFSNNFYINFSIKIWNNAENTVCRGASLQGVLSPAETDNNPPDALSPANRTNFPLLQKLCRSGAHRLLLKGWPKSVLLFPTLSGEDCDLSSGIF